MGRSQTERQPVAKGIDTVNNIKIVVSNTSVGKTSQAVNMKRAVGK